MQRNRGFAAIFLGAVICCLSLTAQAQSATYTYQVTPYLFTTGVNGTIGEQGRTAAVDASFGDVVHHLNMAAMVYFDARLGRWRASIDNLYTNVSDARATPGPLFSNVRVATRMWIVDPEVGCAVLQGEGKELAVTGGVRIWNLKNDLTLFRQSIEADRGSGARSVADPVAGLKFSSDLPHKMFVFAKGDVGGFDAGASLDWQALGGAGFKFNDTVVASVGYRYLSVDYKPSSSVFDVVLKGVIVGIGLRF